MHIPLTASTEERHNIIAKISNNEKIVDFLASLYSFFVAYGFVYLEVNPFTFDVDGQIVCLDMVAKLDSCEQFLQKSHWKSLEFPHPFSEEKTESEKYIERLDAETGASLKLKILNGEGTIWLLTSGGGASVVFADTLGDMGLAHAIANYGECSGNPDRDNTREYTKTLLENLIANGKKNQYLLIAGAIANFTHIDKTFAGIIDALTLYQDALKNNGTKILVRRGGINDKKGLALMQDACKRLGLPCFVADGNAYMTDILSHISL